MGKKIISRKYLPDPPPQDIKWSTPKGIYPRKAQVPDNIFGRVLRYCHLELDGVFATLFNWSISTHSIPTLWKTSAISPILKVSNADPVKLHDYRPIAVTSIIMKCMKRLLAK